MTYKRHDRHILCGTGGICTYLQMGVSTYQQTMFVHVEADWDQKLNRDQHPSALWHSILATGLPKMRQNDLTWSDEILLARICVAHSLDNCVYFLGMLQLWRGPIISRLCEWVYIELIIGHTNLLEN